MSVIVKGMEMPENCDKCLTLRLSFCMTFKCYEKFPLQDGLQRLPDCPLAPLPEKHGRLGDLDELAAGCDYPHWCRWLSEIEDMPTIVEAEGE